MGDARDRIGAAEITRDRRPEEPAHVDHHVEDAEAKLRGPLIGDAGDGAHGHRLENRGADRDEQEAEQEAAVGGERAEQLVAGRQDGIGEQEHLL